MAPKSNKEKKDLKKSAPAESKETAGKPSPKKVSEDEDDEDEDDDADTPKSTAKKTVKASPAKSKKKDNDEDDDDAAEEDEVDEWDKVEEEEEWDPDFDEFDIPRSKTKKGPTGTKKPGKTGDDDDLGLDDDYKNLDLFNDSGFEEEEDDF